MEANLHIDETPLRRASTRGELNELLPGIYDELRAVAHRMMCGERTGHTLQTTALVHEAYVRLVEQRNLTAAEHGPFLAAAANTIRRVLVDHARQRRSAKRGGGWHRLEPLADDGDAGARVGPDALAAPTGGDAIDLLALDEALRKLAEYDARAAEVVTMRYFGGLTVEQIARALEVCPRTVGDDWSMARAWLRRELGGGGGGGGGGAGGATVWNGARRAGGETHA
jgi:RNA polymerase sigma factor (TIGR02999 family)